MIRQKILYGNGEVNLIGEESKGIEINFKGKVKIDDRTPDNCIFLLIKDRILIFTKDGSKIPSELFTYEGHLEIKSIKIYGDNAKRVPSQVKRVMEFPELLNVKAEELEIRMGDVGKGYSKSKILHQNSLKQTTINGLNTISYSKTKFKLEDGSDYSGDFHIHKDSNKIMTGKSHSKLSKLLIVNQFIKRK